MIASVSTVLGDCKPVLRVYGDGSVDCPWCSSPIITPTTQCANPCCDANPTWTPDALQARRDKQAVETARREHEERTRASVLAAVKERAAEHAAWESAQYEEARRRGACLRCLMQAGWERVKFIRHGGICPKETRT